MAETGVIDGRLEPRSGQVLPERGFERMRELMRHGYAPDPMPPAAGGGIRLRHPTGPDLLIQPDGSLDVPAGQPLRRDFRVEPVLAKPRKRRWFRNLMIVLAIALYIFLAMAITAGVIEGL